MLIKKKSLIGIMIWTIISIIENILIKTLLFNLYDLQILSLIIIFNLAIQILILRENNNRIISFFSVFIMFMYLFHFGQLITYALFNDIQFDYTNYISDYTPNKEVLMNALRITTNVINAVFIGGLFTLREKISVDDSYTTDFYDDYPLCKKIGWGVFWISFPFRMLIDVQWIMAAMLFGYAGAESVRTGSGVISAVAGFWYVSLPLVYVSIKNKTNRKIFIVFTLIYLLITMLTGNRGHQLISIVGLMLVMYLHSGLSIRFSDVLKYLVLGFLGLTFLDIIFDMRAHGIAYFLDNFSEIVSYSFKKNIFLETLNDFGGTIFTPYLVLDGYGKSFNPFFGECFIKSFCQVVPDAFGWFREINVSSIYPKMLGTKHQIGGSFVGEMYYNFGEAYWIFPIIFGGIYGKLSSKVEEIMACHEYERLCLYLPFLMYSLWWVRDAVGNFTRPVLWMLILFVVLRYFTIKKGEEGNG